MNPKKNRRNRLGLFLGNAAVDAAGGLILLGGGGGSSGGGADAVLGVLVLVTGGGGGGTNGTLFAGIPLFAIEEGREGAPGSTGPGGGGVAEIAVLLCVPGRTIALESWMDGFVFASGFLISAKHLYRFMMLDSSNARSQWDHVVVNTS